jgi:putative ABC transport system ATP-binding protein
MPYINVESVTKRFERPEGAVLALSEVSLTIERGEFIGISGPSGAGKSTLFNIISGLDRCTSGAVTVDDAELSKLSTDKLALFRRAKVGFVFQSSALLPALTVFENVMLPLVPIAVPDADKRARVERALEAVNIAHRASHLPSELSGGEQQRTAIARAVVNDPELILADEPTADLDVDNATNIIELLEQLNGAGKTILLTSHDASTVGAAKRIIRMESGKIVEWQGRGRGNG